MKEYKSHKTVKAAKILEIAGPLMEPMRMQHAYYLRLDGCEEPAQITAEFMGRHGPEVGGYFVEYADGYQSYSPAKAFEEGYRAVDALPVLRLDREFTPVELEEFRTNWNAMVKANGGRTPDLMISLPTEVTPAPMPVGLTELALANMFGFGDTLPQKIAREWLERQIVTSQYEVRPDGRTTLCELTLRSGATFRGESTCAVEGEFKKDLGELYAGKDALDKAWAAYGVLLRELRHKAGLL